MTLRREEIVHANLRAVLDELASRPSPGTRGGEEGAEPSPNDGLAVIEAAFQSRLLDLEARRLKDAGLGFYTIGSAGHEMNAVLGRILRVTDPCLLHYRSGAFMAARLRKTPGESFLYDTLLSICASAWDPVSGGRHKVWGSSRLWVPPQTSTIASHLPKAVGLAFGIERATHLMGEVRLDAPSGRPRIPEDAIVMCSFGDASLNHASATTAFNSALWAAHQHLPVPILFVCEDNGLGISVHTPRGWVESVFAGRPGMDWFDADGLDLEESWKVARAAVTSCRRKRRPTLLRLRVVRLLGHAGSDVEALYSSETDILAREAKDPLPGMCRLAVSRGWIDGKALRDLYLDLEERVARVAARAAEGPKQVSREEIMAPLAFPGPGEGRPRASGTREESARRRLFGGRLPEEDRPRHMAMQLSRALADLMHAHPEILVFGEDVAKKGGVYHVTADLHARFGGGRVFNTLLDETTILGVAIGAAQAGFLPIPEIQYLAYLHNAEDQLRGEACSQRFFSAGSFDNPMVVRIASFAYQKGFGGHFHNDNSIGVLRDVPGLVLAVPSRGDDAVSMLRGAVEAARRARSVVAFLEPIALYMRKDLHEAGDLGWSFPYPPPGEVVEPGEARSYPAGGEPELLVATYGNGVPMALQARRRAGLEDRVEVLDLRWLAPLPEKSFLEAARRAGALLVVDECRRSGGGIADALLALCALDPACRGLPCGLVAAADSYVPLGPAADLVLPAIPEIEAAMLRLAGPEAGRAK